MNKLLPSSIQHLVQIAWTKLNNRLRPIVSEHKAKERDGIVFTNGCYSHLHSVPLHRLDSVEAIRASDRHCHMAINELPFSLRQMQANSEGAGIYAANVYQEALWENYTKMLRDRLRRKCHQIDEFSPDDEASFSLWLDFIEDSDVANIPAACKGCANYYGQAHGRDRLICAIHPSGVNGDSCEDWETKA